MTFQCTMNFVVGRKEKKPTNLRYLIIKIFKGLGAVCEVWEGCDTGAWIVLARPREAFQVALKVSSPKTVRILTGGFLREQREEGVATLSCDL